MMMQNVVFNPPVGSADTWFYISELVPKGSWLSFILTCKAFYTFNSKRAVAKRQNKLCAFAHTLKEEDLKEFEDSCVKYLVNNAMNKACPCFRIPILVLYGRSDWAYSPYITLRELKELFESYLRIYVSESELVMKEFIKQLTALKYAIRMNRYINFKDLVDTFKPSAILKLRPDAHKPLTDLCLSIASDLIQREDFDGNQVSVSEFKGVPLSGMSDKAKLNREWIRYIISQNTQLIYTNKNIVWEDMVSIPGFLSGTLLPSLYRASWVTDDVILAHPKYPWGIRSRVTQVPKEPFDASLIKHFASFKGNPKGIYQECLSIDNYNPDYKGTICPYTWTEIVLKNALVSFEDAILMSDVNVNLRHLFNHPDFDLSLVCKISLNACLDALTSLDTHPNIKVSDWDMVMPLAIKYNLIHRLVGLACFSKDVILKYPKASWDFYYLLINSESLSLSDLLELVQAGILTYRVTKH